MCKMFFLQMQNDVHRKYRDIAYVLHIIDINVRDRIFDPELFVQFKKHILRLLLSLKLFIFYNKPPS